MQVGLVDRESKVKKENVEVCPERHHGQQCTGNSPFYPSITYVIIECDVTAGDVG